MDSRIQPDYHVHVQQFQAHKCVYYEFYQLKVTSLQSAGCLHCLLASSPVTITGCESRISTFMSDVNPHTRLVEGIISTVIGLLP